MLGFLRPTRQWRSDVGSPDRYDRQYGAFAAKIAGCSRDVFAGQKNDDKYLRSAYSLAF